jgi:glutamate synthase domain-containing protein 3
MRGGEILIRDNVGYRVGIHMKEYGDGPWGGTGKPVIVIGGTAQHFLGEYMAGGLLIVLGAQLGPDAMHPSRHVGTGMHGGRMYIRGRVQKEFLGAEVGLAPMEAEDQWLVQRYIAKYGETFGVDVSHLCDGPFTKLLPISKRPYGRLYAY